MNAITLATRLVACAGCVWLLAQNPAQAALTLTLTPAQSTLLPGNSRTITGTLTNTGAETVTILGTSLTLSGPNTASFSVDVSDFEDNLPFTLTGAQSYTGNFVAALTGNAPQGAYSFTYGVDGQGNSFYHTDAVGRLNAAPVTAAPEPGTLALLMSVTCYAASYTYLRRRTMR